MKKFQSRAMLVFTGILLLISQGVGSVSSEPTPEVQPTQSASSPVEQGTIISATGVVVPEKWAALSFPIGGQLIELNVEEGTSVEPGDIIARLDTTDLDIALAQAEAALGVAEANLALAQAGPRDEEIQQAEDRVEAANARIAVAVAERDRLLATPDPAVVIQAQAEVEQAADAQQDTQEGYDRIIGTIDNWDQYNFEPGDRTPLDGEQNARYALELANLRLAAAQAQLDDLLDGPDADDLQIAEAQIWVAVARRDAAQAYLDLLLAGPSPSDIGVVEAEVQQAEAQVASARAAREQGLLRAPFNGTISEVNFDLGEWLNPGQQVVVVADLATLQVETTDLNELDVALVQIGDSALLTFDALPNVSIQGTVQSIAPKSSEGAGVNYTVIIDLEQVPSALRWGMTAFVDIEG